MSTSTQIGWIPARVAIVGTGNVGATFAYALLQSQLVPEIVLIDENRRRAEGEAMDLSHAVPFGAPTRVTSGGYEDCAGSLLTVITAGAGQKPSESRLQLAGRNVEIFSQIVPKIVAANPDGLILIATNPVDVITRHAQDISGLPFGRVFGSGTMLDSARLSYEVGMRMGLAARSVDAPVLGEHGDSAFAAWSLCRVAGLPLDLYLENNDEALGPDEREVLIQRVRRAALEIIERKGATYYAVAAALLRVTSAIIHDAGAVFPVSIRPQPEDAAWYGTGQTAVSLPCVVGREGVRRVVRWPLQPDEKAALGNSVEILNSAWKSANSN